MARIDLPDGRWLDMRLPTTDEWLALLEAEDADDPVSWVKRVRDMRDALNAACRETSWGGKPSDLSPGVLTSVLVPAWLKATEDDALPPASGTDSGTTSPEPSSPATDAE